MNEEKIRIREIVKPSGTTYRIYVNLDFCKPLFLKRVNIVERDMGWANVYVKHTETLGDAVYNFCSYDDDFCPYDEPTIYKTLEEAKKDLEIIKKQILKEEMISNKIVYSE